MLRFAAAYAKRSRQQHWPLGTRFCLRCANTPSSAESTRKLSSALVTALSSRAAGKGFPLLSLSPTVKAVFGGSSRYAEEAWLKASRLRAEQVADLRELLKRCEPLEQRIVAVCNSIFCSTTGQKVFTVGLPLAAAQLWATESANCLSTSPAKLDVYQAVSSNAGILAALASMYHTLSEELIRWTLEHAGPAFIKWGQWAVTRPDMFPPDLCESLARLHSGAPAHPAQYSRFVIEQAFGRPLEEIFDEFDDQPVASGSIAQVHKAVLSMTGAASTKQQAGMAVAVKVRHPGVNTMMQRDFTLMHRVALLTAHLPVLADLRLDESVRQFGAPLKEQLDLVLEAQHLSRFNHNFRRWKNLSFPTPIFPLVAPDVLVESFEEGRLISSYVKHPSSTQSARLADIGLSCYLKMLLKDNFIHADLHPGNILVRMVDPNSLRGRIAGFFKYPLPPHLVLLDVGMIAELTNQDQQHLVQFFKAITQKDGKMLAENILGFSDDQTCPDPERFVNDMTQLFNSLSPDRISQYTSEVIADMMEQIRRHQVHLKGIVSTVVVTTLVLEGWSTKLNPDINVMDALRDLLPVTLKERAARFVHRCMEDSVDVNSTALPVLA